MITDEELDVIVNNYYGQIKRICDETTWGDTSKILDKVGEINKIANRIEEINGMRKAQKPTGAKNETAAQ